MNKTAFVTGATGFLGTNLVIKLIKEGWDVITYNLPSNNKNYLPKSNVVTIEGNLNDYELLFDSIPNNVDAIFHLAANTTMWNKNAKQQYIDNVIGTRNIVDIAVVKKAKKFIYTSSISAYGYHKDTVTEKTTSNALTCKMNYNKTKYLAEQEVKKGIDKGLFAVILNPINIIGPYDTNNWTRQFIKPVYYNNLTAIPPGEAMWCHVYDIVDAHIAALTKGRNGENYLLGGVLASFQEVVNEIEHQLGKKTSEKVTSKYILKVVSLLMTAKSFFDHKEPTLTYAKYKRAVGSVKCDFKKAEKELDYKTSSLNKMIKDTYSWLISENLL